MTAHAQACSSSCTGHAARTEPHLPAGVPTRLNSLTGLRFLAAYGVLVHHVTGSFAPIPALGRASTFGAAGVTFFFLLSGFVLAWSWTGTGRLTLFYWRRFSRIWPLHALLLVVAVLSQVLWGRVDWTGAALSVPLLQAWVPDQSIYYSGNAPAWSLSCEAFFYAIFPLLMPRVARLPSRVLYAGVACLLVAMLAGSLVAARTMPPQLVEYATYICPAYRLLQFLLGVLAALIVRRGAQPMISTGAATVAVAACPVLVFYVPAALPEFARGWVGHLSAVLVPMAFGLLIVAAAERDIRGLPSRLRYRGLVRLGQWSFAFYLVHLLLVQAAQLGFGKQEPRNANLIVLVALSLLAVALSGLLFSCYERPVERWLRTRGTSGTNQQG